MKTIEFYSLEQQDEFIFNLFNGKTHGTFLDISCANPVVGNNTYMLDKFYNWSGFGFDIYDIESVFHWSKKRNGKFIQADVTSPEFTVLLQDNIPSDTIVDYISLDVDNAGTNLALPTLRRILDAKVRFKAMTFEHEHYSCGELARGPARQLLEGLGYVRLFEDVKLWTCNIGSAFFEDWWIHPDYFDSKLLDIKCSGTYYFDCINILRDMIGAHDYTAYHRCCKAFPTEYNLFSNAEEENNIRPLLKLLNR